MKIRMMMEIGEGDTEILFPRIFYANPNVYNKISRTPFDLRFLLSETCLMKFLQNLYHPVIVSRQVQLKPNMPLSFIKPNVECNAKVVKITTIRQMS